MLRDLTRAAPRLASFVHRAQSVRTQAPAGLAPPRSRIVRKPRVSAMSSSAYTLYTMGTPNGIKASITLEELGVPYEAKLVDIGTNAQKEEWYLKINPNGRIPALVDHSAGDLNVFETGAIMWYLVQKHPEKGLWPKDINDQARAMSWLMWQMGGLGPMQGQANHFSNFAPVQLDYPIKRYAEETLRLFQVLERGLQGREYLVGDSLTIADIASFSWVIFHPFIGLKLDDLPNVKAWVQRIAARPAVQKGASVPVEGFASKFLKLALEGDFTTDPDVKEKFEKAEAKLEAARKALAK